MIKSQDKVLLLMKKNPWTDLAKAHFENLFENLTIIEASERNIPDIILRWKEFDDYPDIDWIISFVCQWVIPPEILKLAKKGAINFHPGPPEYPGTGCYNFAILNGAKEYGVTCHKMVESVDVGPIIKVVRFPMPMNIDVLSLKHLTMGYLLSLLYDIVGQIWLDKYLLINGEKWTRKAYTRKDLLWLCDLTSYLIDENLNNSGISEKGLEKVLRATYFPEAPDGPFIEVNGRKWRLSPE